MKKKIRKRMIRCYLMLMVALMGMLIMSMTPDWRRSRFPFEAQGLSKQEAAAHLLSRFTYGADRAQIDAVVKMGLERWFEEQLRGDFPEDKLQALLCNNDLSWFTNSQVAQTFVSPAQLTRRAKRDGAIGMDSLADKITKRKAVEAYGRAHGLKFDYELVRQLSEQRVWHALYSPNQLREVMSDFWFNHFTVSFAKATCRPYVPVYERDVIRPNALGRFGPLLQATAQSPAMLIYLDNFRNGVDNSKKPKKVTGLNENYAREVMELHTLGVDGGYTQQDVTEAARVLTGWTVYPLNRENAITRLSEQQLLDRGYVHKGDFLFIPQSHDQGEKTVLGKHFQGGGYEEGEALLAMLASQASTARFISRKLAIRFVSDSPPPALVERMAATFTESDGDIRAVLTTMAYAPEFWSPHAVRMKTKSPFELAISAVRSLHADVKDPTELMNWVDRMGQKMYFYQAPTGFPDRGTYWINTGSLLNRMNFGLALASMRIRGTTYDALALNHQHEPESAEDALLTYTHLMLPERKTDETIRRLTPLINDPELSGKVDKAAKESTVPHSPQSTVNAGESGENDEEMMENKKVDEQMDVKPVMEYRLDQVIGIIIGSPEFQRR